MATIRPKTASSVLVVVDLQPKFLAPIFERDRVIARAKFLIQAANLLGIPVLATEQVPEKMGGTHPEIRALLPPAEPPIAKTVFGCTESEEFMSAFERHRHRHVIVIGIETPICVSQTALGLLDRDYEVVVCPDGVSSRSLEMHKLGMERIRDAGAAPIHTEAVVYEWLESAAHPRFRDVLELVKKGDGA